MTQDEAEAIAQIVGTADGGCSTCVHLLVDRLNAAGLGWRFEMTDEEQREQPDWSDDPEEMVYVGRVVRVEQGL